MALSECMNKEQWSQSNDAIEMLVALKEQSEDVFLKRVRSLQRFYIKCCRKKLFLLSQEEFKNGLDIAEAYISNRATRKDVSEQNWKTEGEVFGIEYGTDPIDTANCLKKVRIHTGLSQNKAKEYAVNLGYFIDWTMLYATDFNGEIPAQYSRFLLPELLKNEISNPF